MARVYRGTPLAVTSLRDILYYQPDTGNVTKQTVTFNVLRT